jgi:uracil-DNA glycosylase family 4
MSPDCDSFVPGYGDANADFHVVGDHPRVHGGVETGVPFTGTESSERFQTALERAGLLDEVGNAPELHTTFFTYLHMCVPDGPEPTDTEYDDMERFVDTEIRAITAHVLLPVGERATQYVLDNYTAQARKIDVDMAALHGTEIRGSGWLVYPVRDPSEWESGDDDRLVEALQELQATDYRQISDLGRFLAGDEPYRVR